MAVLLEPQHNTAQTASLCWAATRQEDGLQLGIRARLVLQHKPTGALGYVVQVLGQRLLLGVIDCEQDAGCHTILGSCEEQR